MLLQRHLGFCIPGNLVPLAVGLNRINGNSHQISNLHVPQSLAAEFDELFCIHIRIPPNIPLRILGGKYKVAEKMHKKDESLLSFRLVCNH